MVLVVEQCFMVYVVGHCFMVHYSTVVIIHFDFIHSKSTAEEG